MSTFRRVWKFYSWCWFFLFVSRGYDSLKGIEQLYILSWTHILTKSSLWGFTLCRGCKSTKIFTDIIVIITNIFSSITKKSQYTLFLVLARGHVSIFWELRQSHFHLVKIDSIWPYDKSNTNLWSESSVWITLISKISIMVYINKPKYIIYHTMSRKHLVSLWRWGVSGFTPFPSTVQATHRTFDHYLQKSWVYQVCV